MLFEVRLFDAAASAVRHTTVDSESRGAIAAHYAAAGAVVLSVRPIRRRGTVSWAGGRPTLDVSWWCRELRTLVAAGMTVVEALETLNAQSLEHVMGPSRAQVQATLVSLLRQGQSLSAAMQAAGCFPSVLVASVKASERTSSLVEALDDFLRYHEMLERMRKQVVSAAIYPAVVVALGFAVSLFLLLFVIPRFSRMYADLRGPVSWATKALVAFSHALTTHGLLISGVMALALVTAGVGWRSGMVAGYAGMIAEIIGPLRRRIDEFRLAKLFHSLTLMVRGGYALDDALRHCAGLGLGVRISAALERAQRSGRGNLNSAISGNSRQYAGSSAIWRGGVFDGQEISEAHPAHAQPGVQGTGRLGGVARGQDAGRVGGAV